MHERPCPHESSSAAWSSVFQVPLCYQDIQKAMVLEPQHEGAQALMQKLLKRAQKAKAEAVNKALMGDLGEAILKINFALENSPLEAEYFIFR